MDKRDELVKNLNQFVNKSFADLKNNPKENSTEDDLKSYNALKHYNIMLDHITIGAHTTMTVNYVGRDWTFRLLTAGENLQIHCDCIKRAEELKVFDDYVLAILSRVKIIQLALTPSPFKTSGVDILTEEHIMHLAECIVEPLYHEYTNFVGMATAKPQEMSNEDIEDIIAIVKKKQQPLTDLSYWKLWKVVLYQQKYSESLEKIVKSDTTN